jgi:Ca-activated chloride channel family protein
MRAATIGTRSILSTQLLWFSLLAIALFSRPAAAQEEEPRSGALLFRSETGDVPAPRVHTDINMTVSGIVARVQVAQQFQNPGDQWVEAVYAFPLPENSAVNQLQMQVGERVIVGEIREKAQAQQLYVQARENGQRASVVHQQRPNIFRTAVANIGPHETIKITLTYLQIVDHQGGRNSLRFPLTITPRYGDSQLQPQFAHPNTSRQSVRLDISIDAGVPVEYITSAYHKIKVNNGSGNDYRVELAETSTAPDRDFELSWTPIVHGQPTAVLFREATDAAEHVLLMFMPPQERGVVRTSREVIFIIDTSGSMSGTSMEQAREALLTGLKTLLPTDRFNLIQFNSTHDCLFDSPVPATADNLAVARRYVTGLHANGGTEMLPALTAAFTMPPSPEHLRQVLFITDGAVSNESDLMYAIRQGLGDARLFTVGIGSAPNGYFMRTAAQMGRGTFTFIGQTSEVEQRMNELLRKLTAPVLTDITLYWPDGVTPEYAPTSIGDLYADEPLLITARLPQKVAGTLNITGQSVRTWGRQIPLNAAESRTGVATLWARNRIEDMVNQQAQGVTDDVIRAQVLPLALEYQIVSKYTSLVAIDKTPVRRPDESLHSSRIENTKPHGQNWQATGMPTTATPAELQLWIGALALLAAALLFISSRRKRV